MRGAARRGICRANVVGDETEAAPIQYVAELIGIDPISERAIRKLIALIVLRCDPLAMALTASARRTFGEVDRPTNRNGQLDDPTESGPDSEGGERHGE